MNRRNFVSTAAFTAAAATVTAAASENPSERQFLEFRKYQPIVGDKKKDLLNKFLQDAAIPAWNRLGIQPVGVFTVMYGQSSPSLYVLLPHNSMESALTANTRLLADQEFLAKGAEVLNSPLADPPYVRYESTLMAAFAGMPQVEIPDAVKDKKSRIFEMRTYESHNEKIAKKKIEMFNEGKEIEIFRKTGLFPVFFGETIFGQQMPNLTYMLAFENMEMRDANWKTFVSSPEWKELSGKEEYKDTVSNISDLILRPASFSQI